MHKSSNFSTYSPILATFCFDFVFFLIIANYFFIYGNSQILWPFPLLFICYFLDKLCILGQVHEIYSLIFLFSLISLPWNTVKVQLLVASSGNKVTAVITPVNFLFTSFFQISFSHFCFDILIPS